jgi:transposase-like protein
MHGQNIPRIQETFNVDFNTKVPYTTLHGWISEIDEPLHEFVTTTLIPYSGHWHHDETFLRIGGRKAYALSTIDEITGFLAPPTISFKNDKTAARTHLNAAKRPGNTRVLSMVTDGTSTIAPLFKTRYLKYAQRQQGITHFKWRISRKLRKLAGISESSVKPLPKEYRTLQWLFYHVLDSHDETHAYICIERLRPAVLKANEAYLTTLFNDMEAKLSQITAWQRNPAIAKTNNKSENSNQQYPRHRSFKARCRIIVAAQRIADLTFVRYNRLQLEKYLEGFRIRKETFEVYWAEEPRDPTLKGGHIAFWHEENRLKRVTGEFDKFWDDYMAVK